MLKIALMLFVFTSLNNAFILPESIDRLLDPRVVGGENAPDGGIPYQVSLRIFDSHTCGGSILNSRWILTAAHCTVGISASDLTVVVGTNSLVNGGDRYSIKTIVVHENYDNYNIKNDISLLYLNEEIQFNDRIQPIDLPERDTAEGSDVLLTGWGTTSYPGTLPVNLQMIHLKTLSVNDCQKKAQAVNIVGNTEICTLTQSGEGACHGDSGGPLVEGKQVVGVVSWGMPCARGYPDVYTRVYSYRDWILNHIG